jgi:hypothetical protein
MKRRTIPLWQVIFFEGGREKHRKKAGIHPRIRRAFPIGIWKTLLLRRNVPYINRERGYCVPRLAKLINISDYFGVSLDCILRGRAIRDNALEKNLCGTAEPLYFHSEGQLLSKFLTLSDRNRERMMGYLDALYGENGI